MVKGMSSTCNNGRLSCCSFIRGEDGGFDINP